MSDFAARGSAMATTPSTREKSIGHQLLSDRAALCATIALSMLAAAAMSFSRIQAVWKTGAFFDPDDAMRAVEVRDLLAGQGWFDLIAHRVDPPNGLLMHWSRIVDAPLAALNILFAHFLSPEYAERATRLVFPFMLLAALFVLVAWLASILSDRSARPAAVWLTLLSGAVFLQFAPGRIDHHAPQIVTLAATLCFFLQGLDPTRASRLAYAAALMALSLAISLENLPFFVVMIAALPLIFILDGERARAQLLWFSRSGARRLSAVLRRDGSRPSAYSLSVCDAFPPCISPRSLSARLARATRARCAATRHAIDARHRHRARRRASRSRASGSSRRNASAIRSAVSIRCCAICGSRMSPRRVRCFPSATIAKHRRRHGGTGTAWPSLRRWSSPGATEGVVASPLAPRRSAIAIGLAAGLWQTRVFTSVTPLAMAPLAVAIVALIGRFSVGAPLRAALVAVLAALVSPMGLALALPSGDDSPGAERACLNASALAPLAALPPARVAAPSISARIFSRIRRTPSSPPPITATITATASSPTLFSRPRSRRRRCCAPRAPISLLWCEIGRPPSALVAAAPQGLAAALARGETPAWLERKALAETPLRVFALRPAKE